LLGKRVTRHGSGERIDLLEPSDAQGTLARIHPLLDGVWKGHVGYASIGQEELAEVFGGVLSLMTSRHIGVLVDGSGQDTGCSFMYPDYANDVRNLRGSARGWGEWLGRGSQPSGLVMHTLALLEEARGSAGSAMLLQRGLEHFFEDGYERLIVALVVEDWPLFRRFKAPSRRYALYEGQAGNFETG
jgi:hypothetical protein